MNTQKNHWIRLVAAAVFASTVAVAIPALVVAPAYAATQTITIAKSGFVPMNLSIKTGDTVSYTNSDAVAHQVLFKQTTGFTCTVSPLVVQPTKTESCTWTVAGSYTYSDPNQKGNSFRGTIRVETPVVPTLSLAASSPVVNYGNTSLTLSGKIDPSATGTSVDILAMASGETAYTKLTSVATTGGGTYSVSVTPTIQTSYRAEYASGGTRIASSVVSVQVRPRVGLTLRSVKNGYGYLTTEVISDLSYAGRYVLVQRRNSLGGWTSLKRVALGAFSSARFAVRLPSGTSRIRTFLPASQAGAGYLAAASRAVYATR